MRKMRTTYPIHRDADDEHISYDIRDAKGQKRRGTRIAVLQEIFERCPESPEPSATSEDSSEEEADGPHRNNSNHGLGDDIKHFATEDTPVKEKDG